MARVLRRLALWGVALAVIGLAGLAATRQAAFLLGARQVDAILGPATGDRAGEATGEIGRKELRRLATWTQQRFRDYGAQSASGDAPALYRLAPYLTNRRIPEPFRLPPGAIETLYGEGLCDSAARTLGFLASARGLDFRQFNIVAATGAHSVVEVGTADGPVMVDPFYGFIENGSAMGAAAVLDALRHGADVDATLAPLLAPGRRDFYEEIDPRALGAFQGAGLELAFTLPDTAAGTALGAVDGAPNDVEAAGSGIGVSPYFSYLGSRYDRSWRRVLRAETPLEVRIISVGALDRAFIDGVVAPAPVETGPDWALFRIGPDQPLVLDDSRAPLRLSLGGNYQPIDRIEVARP